jgi:cell wall-associated NlpC family hydrolase
MTVTPVRQAVIAAGMTQVGVPYSYGGGDISGPSLGIEQGATVVGYDCARFTRYAFYQGARKFLAYGSEQQWAEGVHVGDIYSDLAKATPGDLIFFNGFGHVGIYVGPVVDPWRNSYPGVLNAPHTGTNVRVEPIYPNEGGLVVCGIRQYLPKS